MLETSRLLVRELAFTDISKILEYANNDSINRYLSFGSIGTESGARQYLTEAVAASSTSPRLSYKLGMAIKPLSTLSGSCWLDIEDIESRHASIGYFVDKDHWNQGYATEMIMALLQFGFQKLELHRIYANCDAENSATRRVLEKINMRQEGLLREHCLRSYGWADVCIYGILCSEWKNNYTLKQSEQ